MFSSYSARKGSLAFFLVSLLVVSSAWSEKKTVDWKESSGIGVATFASDAKTKLVSVTMVPLFNVVQKNGYGAGVTPTGLTQNNNPQQYEGIEYGKDTWERSKLTLLELIARMGHFQPFFAMKIFSQIHLVDNKALKKDKISQKSDKYLSQRSGIKLASNQKLVRVFQRSLGQFSVDPRFYNPQMMTPASLAAAQFYMLLHEIAIHRNVINLEWLVEQVLSRNFMSSDFKRVQDAVFAAMNFNFDATIRSSFPLNKDLFQMVKASQAIESGEACYQIKREDGKIFAVDSSGRNIARLKFSNSAQIGQLHWNINQAKKFLEANSPLLIMPENAGHFYANILCMTGSGKDRVLTKVIAGIRVDVADYRDLFANEAADLAAKIRTVFEEIIAEKIADVIAAKDKEQGKLVDQFTRAGQPGHTQSATGKSAADLKAAYDALGAEIQTLNAKIFHLPDAPSLPLSNIVSGASANGAPEALGVDSRVAAKAIKTMNFEWIATSLN